MVKTRWWNWVKSLGIPNTTSKTQYNANYVCDALYMYFSWWRHQMETFSALLALCAGNSPVSGEFPSQRPVSRSFDVFFHLRLNTRLSKQSRGWWFETLSCSLWRHCNAIIWNEYHHFVVLKPSFVTVASFELNACWRTKILKPR